MLDAMKSARLLFTGLSLLGFSGLLGACGDDDDDGGLSEAQRHGVGAACGKDDDCYAEETALTCLPFKGGYCGLKGCAGNEDCPPGSACVQHDDGQNYCFLTCTEKIQCNPTRPPEIEANCSSNITFVDDKNTKACVPPS
jgi:hypothetical protein